ncbi:hypothetical protein SAMN04487786_1864 [Paenisporosarcina quisquiliarum]|nr:DUF456 family protein [Psychrobacillus psychrodurans]SEM46394.1 hypothetical protein SAMN04487786_1864 [Paenisporosarcina quisquiliarum]SFN02970.1 hypothetical protein SAMN05421832_1123 [Psychrobacillus psychrodurans]
MIETIGWILIVLCFIVAFVGTFYPIIPSVVFMLLGYVLYGLFFSFTELTLLFWVIQILFVILLFSADMAANAFGVKKFGGTKAGMWGSTIGLLFGPFVIPVAGILIGPFIGAVIAELFVTRHGLKQAIKSGVGSLIGFLTSSVVKVIVLVIMLIVFVFFV